MKFSKKELLQAKNNVIVFDDTVTFAPEVFNKMTQIRGLHDVNVAGEIHYDANSEKAFVDLDIEGIMVLPCSISLEDVDYSFHTSSKEVFSFVKDDDDDVIEAKGDVIEILPLAFQVILLEIPLKVVKEDIDQYPKGNGWEVMKEEDYNKAKKDEIDPRLAKLKEFKIEE